MSKHLVTGVAGFLGKMTAEQLIKRGHEVIGVDINPDPDLERLIDYRLVDVRDQKRLTSAMRGVEVVHHHAALVPLTRAYSDFVSVNVDGSRTVAEVAKEQDVRSFVHTSSSAIFGKTLNRPIDSLHPTNPVEPYGKSKLAGELAVKQVFHKGETQLVVIRPRTIIGSNRGGIFELLFRWIRDSKPVFTVGNGENLFQFIHIEDLISAYFCALDSGTTGDFNVGTDSFSTLNAAFTNLIQYAGSQSRLVHLPISATMISLEVMEKLKLSPLAPWHYKTFHYPFYYDITPLTNLGWQPQYSNDAMFENAYASFLETSAEVQKSSGLSPHRGKLDGKFLDAIQSALAKVLK